MAIVKSKEQTLHKARNKHYIYALWGLGALIVTSFVVYLTGSSRLSLLVLVPFIFTLYHLNKGSIFSYGIKGEKKVLKKLAVLGDEYIIYNDITIEHEGRTAQIDHLVLSPYGVLCIETKNMKGRITGTEEDKSWRQRKVGQKGGVYYKDFYNPCKQCKGHIYKLRGFLGEKGLGNIWIQPLVVFTRVWGSTLRVSTDTPVIKVNSLLQFMEQGRGRSLDPAALKKLESIMDSVAAQQKSA